MEPLKSRIAHRNQDKVCQCRTDVSHNHSVLEKWLMDDGNHTGKYFLSCSYLYMFNSHCRAVHSCALNICSLQYIITTGCGSGQSQLYLMVLAWPGDFNSPSHWMPGQSHGFRSSPARTSLITRIVHTRGGNSMADYATIYTSTVTIMSLHFLHVSYPIF